MTPHSSNAAVPAKTQTELDHTPEELAHMGAFYAPGRLGDGARDRLGYCKEDAALLAPMGFDAAWIALMTPRVRLVSDQKNVRVSTQSAARPGGEAAAARFEEGKAWLKRSHGVVAVLPRAVAALAPLTPHHGDRPATLSGTLRLFAKFFADHDAETKPAGGGASFARQGTDLADAYDQARSGHKVDLAKVHPEVFQLHVDEGIVAGELMRLSDAAHAVLSHDRQKLYALTDMSPRPSGRKKSARKSTGGAQE